jgi:hypothetical protein
MWGAPTSGCGADRAAWAYRTVELGQAAGAFTVHLCCALLEIDRRAIGGKGESPVFGRRRSPRLIGAVRNGRLFAPPDVGFEELIRELPSSFIFQY